MQSVRLRSLMDPRPDAQIYFYFCSAHLWNIWEILGETIFISSNLNSLKSLSDVATLQETKDQSDKSDGRNMSSRWIETQTPCFYSSGGTGSMWISIRCTLFRPVQHRQHCSANTISGLACYYYNHQQPWITWPIGHSHIIVQAPGLFSSGRRRVIRMLPGPHESD